MLGLLHAKKPYFNKNKSIVKVAKPEIAKIMYMNPTPPNNKKMIKKGPDVCPHRMIVLYMDMSMARFSIVVWSVSIVGMLVKLKPSAIPNKTMGMKIK